MRDYRKTATAILLSLPLYALGLWCLTPTPGLAGGDGPWDADSWKSLIAEDCRAFYDGCNNCRRAEGSETAACTRKACAVYEKPRCLDAPITEGSMGKTPFEGKLVEFACDADDRTHTAYRLGRERAASGAKYSDGRLEFWEHGGEAMLRQGGNKLYQGCRVDR